jgi:hypothetical protein
MLFFLWFGNFFFFFFFCRSYKNEKSFICKFFDEIFPLFFLYSVNLTAPDQEEKVKRKKSFNVFMFEITKTVYLETT